MKRKIRKQRPHLLVLSMLIIGSLVFVAQPIQAGFFDWISWNKVKTIFIKEQVLESLPASISEPIKEIPLSEETIPKTSVLEIQETSEEIRPVANSEATAPEKVIYRDNPDQEITIKNLRNQIASLQNQIKNLEKQIDDLLSKLPEIKIVTKEVPVEKIVIREIIKEVPKEKIIIKEVPVEKIITKEVPVPQTCPVCQSCQVCSSNLESIHPTSPVVGSLSIQKMTVGPYTNSWKITAAGEPIQITDIVFQFIKRKDPNNYNNITWGLLPYFEENTKILILTSKWWGVNTNSVIDSSQVRFAGSLPYRTCDTAISYDEELDINWALPECIANPTDQFAQYRNKFRDGRNESTAYGIINPYTGSRISLSGIFVTLYPGDTLYFDDAEYNVPIKIYGIGKNSGKIIESGNQ